MWLSFPVLPTIHVLIAFSMQKKEGEGLGVFIRWMTYLNVRGGRGMPTKRACFVSSWAEICKHLGLLAVLEWTLPPKRPQDHTFGHWLRSPLSHNSVYLLTYHSHSRCSHVFPSVFAYCKLSRWMVVRPGNVTTNCNPNWIAISSYVWQCKNILLGSLVSWPDLHMWQSHVEIKGYSVSLNFFKGGFICPCRCMNI